MFLTLRMCCTPLSRSIVSDSLRPRGLWPTRLLCPWGSSQQEYWSGLPCPPPGDLPNSEIEPRSPALQVDSLPSEPWTRPKQFNGGVSGGASGGAGGPQACFPAVLPSLRPLTFNSVQPKRLEIYMRRTQSCWHFPKLPAQARASSQPPFLDSGPALRQCKRRS